ncbi:helix-turn-helix domain-containing protein [Methylorubrum sp. SB2]|uniref:helix-turn-helix domain-containing protein n=1 Tax=Methylorubrum subtropicum TaxID=3138812 RepID=UPI00313E5CE9
MPTRLSFKEALARRDDPPAERPVLSGSPARLRLSMAEPIPQPVTVAQTIRAFGTTLREAHAALDWIAAGHGVPLEVTIPKGRDPVAKFAALGIHAQVLEAEIDVRAIREGLDLTQTEFASRFGLDPATVQSWEQGRTRPDPVAAVLLRVIATNPAAVDAALMP